MIKRLRLSLLVLMTLMLLACGADWAVARSRLGMVLLETVLEPASVVADGKSTIVLTVRVTERGRPRAGDLLQAWLDVGSGLLKPTWVYTDQDGIARISFTPNAMTPYEVQDRAQIHVRDTTIGWLIEVGKDVTVTVPLILPVEPAEQKPGMTFGE